jgi:hypothetical protein
MSWYVHTLNHTDNTTHASAASMDLLEERIKYAFNFRVADVVL